MLIGVVHAVADEPVFVGVRKAYVFWSENGIGAETVDDGGSFDSESSGFGTVVVEIFKSFTGVADVIDKKDATVFRF